MKYGTIISGKLKLSATGLPIVETNPPSDIPYGQKAVSHYEQRGSEIQKVWALVPWTEEERAAIEAAAAEEAAYISREVE